MILKERKRIGEIMDDPDLSSEQLHTALNGLRRINVVSFTALLIWQEIKSHVNKKKDFSVLDIGCGSGDIICALEELAAKDGITLRTLGLDINPLTIEFASKIALSRGSLAKFECKNVLSECLPDGFSVVISSLFLHHLSDHEVQSLLKAMAISAELVLISDLKRSLRSYLLAAFATRLLSFSHVVHVDALRSVCAAFTKKEILELAKAADLKNIKMKSVFPGRFLLSARSN